MVLHELRRGMTATGQWFSSFQNRLGTRACCRTQPQSVGLGRSEMRNHEFSFSASFWVIVLIWIPHFENHYLSAKILLAPSISL